MAPDGDGLRNLGNRFAASLAPASSAPFQTGRGRKDSLAAPPLFGAWP